MRRNNRISNTLSKAVSIALVLALVLGLTPAIAIESMQQQTASETQQVTQTDTTTPILPAEGEESLADEYVEDTDTPDVGDAQEQNPTTDSSRSIMQLLAAPLSQETLETLADEGDPQDTEYVVVTYVYPPLPGESIGIQEDVRGAVGETLPALPDTTAGSLDPADYNKVSFLGWHTTPIPDDSDVPYNLYTTLTSEMVDTGVTLYAVFSEYYLVSYKDASGTIVQTNKLLPGSPIFGPTQETVDALVAPTGTRFAHWYIEGEDETLAFTFGSSALVSADVIFKPYFTSNFIVVFDSGGSYVPSQTIESGQYVLDPGTPAREGYTFIHWYEKGTNEDTAFVFATTAIHSDKVLLAKWTPTPVSYSVAIWMEKPNFTGTPTPGELSHYNYVDTVTLTGTAGTMTDLDVTNLPVDIACLFSGDVDSILKYSEPQSIMNKEILGNGNTVLNLYASRKLYTYTFDLGAETGRTMTIAANGTEYESGTATQRYSFQVKFEQDISSTFPLQGVDFAEFSDGFHSWIRDPAMQWKTEYRARLASIRKYVDEGMLSQKGEIEDYTLTASWTTRGNMAMYRYFVQVDQNQDISNAATAEYSGSTFVLMEEYNQNFVGEFILSAKLINGLSAIQPAAIEYRYNPDTNTYYQTESSSRCYCFFYERSMQPLAFDEMTPENSTIVNVPPNEEVGFELSLQNYKPDTDPSDSTGSYIFKGWYRDAAYNEPFDWNASMPQGGIKAYAKWESTDKTLYFLEDRGGNVKDTQGVLTGGFAQDKDEYWRIGDFEAGKGAFAGWAYDISGIPVTWNFETRVLTDYTIYATWKTSGFSITYDTGEGTGQVPQDTSSYTMYTAARVLDGSKLTPPAGEAFYAWFDANTNTLYYPGDFIDISQSGNVTLVAQYAPLNELISVTYHSNDQNAATSVVYIPKNSAKDFYLADAIFTRANHELLGWALSPSAASLDYSLGQKYASTITTDLHFHAVWKSVPQILPSYRVTYNPNGGVANGTASSFTQIVQTGTLVPYYSAARANYSFNGWFYNGVAWDFNNRLMPYGNITLVAQWTQDVTYNVYYDANGGVGVPATQYGYYRGSTALVSTSVIPSRAGYLFGGWSTSRTGTTPLSWVTLNTNHVWLYAIWTPIQTYTITYDPNGGTGAQSDGTAYNPGDTVTLLGPGTVARTGFEFQGWSLTPGGTVVENFTINENTTVYAVWQAATAPVVPPGTTTPPVDTETPGAAPVATPFGEVIANAFGGEVPHVNLFGNEVPLAAIGFDAWALINLVLTVIGALLAVLFLVLYVMRRKKEGEPEPVEESTYATEQSAEYREEESKDTKKRLVWRIAAGVLAAFAIIFFIITENMSLPMVLVDQWTLAHVLIMAVQIVCFVVASKRKTQRNQEQAV